MENFLNKYGQSNCKVAITSFEANCKLKKNTGDAVSQLQYSQVISSLMYLMNVTRPDIAYSVSRLSRYVTPLTRHPKWVSSGGATLRDCDSLIL